MTATEAAPRQTGRGAPPAGGEVRAALTSEATKLRSVRSTVWTLVVAVVAVVGIGAIITAARVSRWNDLSLRERLSLDPTTVSLRGVFLAQLAIGVLGVLVISSEYTTGMIRTTFAAVPRRPLILFAKAVTFTVVAFVVSTVACFVAFFIGQSILSAKHSNVSITDSGVLRAVLGAGTYLTLVGLLGIGLGTLLRRTAGAIATLFGLVLVLPALTEALPSPWDTDVGKLLPINAGRALFAVRPSTDLLSPGQGFLVLLATVSLTARRDRTPGSVFGAASAHEQASPPHPGRVSGDVFDAHGCPAGGDQPLQRGVGRRHREHRLAGPGQRFLPGSLVVGDLPVAGGDAGGELARRRGTRRGDGEELTKPVLGQVAQQSFAQELRRLTVLEPRLRERGCETGPGQVRGDERDALRRHADALESAPLVGLGGGMVDLEVAHARGAVPQRASVVARSEDDDLADISLECTDHCLVEEGGPCLDVAEEVTSSRGRTGAGRMLELFDQRGGEPFIRVGSARRPGQTRDSGPRGRDPACRQRWLIRAHDPILGHTVSG
jgi:hypothetical protein